jgi:predicted transcriptional regulator
MTTVVKEKKPIELSPALQRRAGIVPGDQVEIKASRGSITITPLRRTYKPTKAEWAAIRKGEAEIARGEYITLTDLLHDLDHQRRKGRSKTARKTPR